MSLITSRTNPKIKEIRLLRQRKMRQASGLFLVEGLRHVGEAIEAGARLESLVYAPERLESAFGLQLVEQQRQRGVPCLEVSAEVFESLADKDNPVGLIAVVRQPEWKLTRLHPQNFPAGVALVGVQDPGNLGTILRTVDAVGASGLLLLEGSVDPFHPQSVRASMGSLFWKPLASASFAEFLAWARRGGYHLVGASAHAALDYRQVAEYPQPRILLLGSERAGLTEEQAAACDLVVRLPMLGHATSLNLAVAAGVMLYAMLAADQKG